MQRILVDQAMRGDQEAFARLVDASIDRCYAVATLVLRDREAAHDAVQEAFVSAWRDIASLRDPSAWEAWLYRLTVRSCYRHARKQRRRNVVELRVLPEHDAAGAPDLAIGVAERDAIERRLGHRPPASTKLRNTREPSSPSVMEPGESWFEHGGAAWTKRSSVECRRGTRRRSGLSWSPAMHA